MVKPKSNSPSFRTLKMADVSLTHIPRQDRDRLLHPHPPALLTRADDGVWAVFPVFYDPAMRVQYASDLLDAGFSCMLLDVLDAAEFQGCDYVRFDADGQTYSWLNQFPD